MAAVLMFAPEALDLAVKAINLYQTLKAENRAATDAERAALWAAADSADAAAVAADDAAQKAAGEKV